MSLRDPKGFTCSLFVETNSVGLICSYKRIESREIFGPADLFPARSNSICVYSAHSLNETAFEGALKDISDLSLSAP